jgi:hypothetical protein
MTPPVEPRGCSAGRLPVVNTKSWMGVAWQRQRLHRIRDATVMGDDGRGDGTCPLRRRGGLVRRACRLVNSSRGTADRTARGAGIRLVSGRRLRDWYTPHRPCRDGLVGGGSGRLSRPAPSGQAAGWASGAGLVRADAARLPFRAGSCPLVVSAFTHTDVDDFTNLAREPAVSWRRMAGLSTSTCIRALPAPSPSSHEPMAPAWSIPDMRGQAGRPAAQGRLEAA